MNLFNNNTKKGVMQVEVDNLMIMDEVYYESWNRQDEIKGKDKNNNFKEEF